MKTFLFGVLPIILIISACDVVGEEGRGNLVSEEFLPPENGYHHILVQDDWPTHIQPEMVEVIYEPTKAAFDVAVKQAVESRICERDVPVKKTVVTRWSPSRPPSRWVSTYILEPCEVAVKK